MINLINSISVIKVRKHKEYEINAGKAAIQVECFEILSFNY